MMTGATIGVFGGSGLYDFVDPIDVIDVDTPYGRPSAPITIAEIAGKRVAFLPRHGLHHEHIAHLVPFRANVWAMHQLGVRAILAPCTVGSLQADIHPGTFVVIDQLVDRTWGRPDTFQHLAGANHVAFADPYDPALRQVVLRSGRQLGLDVRDGGTMVVINGPRFSTRAESRWFRDMGWHVVNMTGYPEAVLAAELALPYAAIALVTDYDAGVDGHEPVTMDAVLAVFKSNVERVKQLLLAAIGQIELQ